MPDEQESINNLPAIKILQQIQDGIIEKENLPKEMRQECVEYLLSKFQDISYIANALGKTEKTIRRDKEEIEQRHAQKPSIDYSLQLISELMRKANSTQNHLMSLARDKEGSVQEKSQAAFYLWKAIQEQMKLLQSFGYLPEQPTKIEANITHEEEKDVNKLKEELAELENIVNASGRANDPEIMELIKSIKQDIALAQADKNIDELRKIIQAPKEDPKNTDESSS